MTTMKARPTTYAGVQMRSRLEAQYAAHLDATGRDWSYEPKCFADRKGQYLPDFLVDGVYVEVKPTAAKAKSAKEVMERVLSTEPNATLEVVTPIGEWPEVSFQVQWTRTGGSPWLRRPDRPFVVALVDEMDRFLDATAAAAFVFVNGNHDLMLRGSTSGARLWKEAWVRFISHPRENVEPGDVQGLLVWVLLRRQGRPIPDAEVDAHAFGS
jgi:hypothetical protein